MNTPEAGSIEVQTSTIKYAGVHQATLQASLRNYPDVPSAEVKFVINIVDPCPTEMTAAMILLNPDA